MSVDILDTLGLAINGILVLLIAYTNKKDTNKSNARIDNHSEMIFKCQTDIKKLEDNEKKDEIRHTFRMDMKNVIKENSSIKINGSEILTENPIIVSGLTEYFKEIPEFALTFFYSSLRNNDSISKIDFRRYLKKELDSLMYLLVNTIKVALIEEKSYFHGKSTIGIYFYEYFQLGNTKELEQAPCYVLNNLLLDDLIKNGIDYSKLKRVFIEYTESFIEVFRRQLIEFMRLQSRESEIDKLLED